MGSAQDPRVYAGGGGLGLRGGWACSGGSPSQCPQRLKPTGGEGVAMAAPPLVHHWTIMPCFYGGLGVFHKLSWLWSSLLLSLQAVFSQPTAVPSVGPCSKLHFLAPAPLHNRRHMTQTGVHSAAAETMRSSYFVLPATDCLLCSSIPQRSLPVPANFPIMRGFSKCGNLSSSSASCQGCWPLFDSSFFSFFHPTWLWGDVSWFFRCQNSSANVQQVLCENCSTCRCILDVLFIFNIFIGV